MEFDHVLLDIDYLIYSSHKTATQTLVRTLKANSYKCTHCHTLTNDTIQLKHGVFLDYLEQYYLHNDKRKLNVITVFREPIERYISSFFQTYGDDVVKYNWVQDITKTIIYQDSIQSLQEKFIRELDNQTLKGGFESIDEICSELNLNTVDLNYDADKQYGALEVEHCKLFILRFDILIYGNQLECLLSEVTGKAITQKNANISSSKWYQDTFKEFKSSVKIPQEIIVKTYESKRELISLLYSGEYNRMLTKALNKYG